jgi:hypothetical protein
MTHVQHKLDTLHHSLLHGKLPRNLHWDEALELIGHLGRVEPTHGGEFAFVVGAQRAFFKRPHASEFGLEEVSRLRRFLKEAAADPVQAPVAAPGGQPCRMVVVIDHHAAHVFRDLGGSRPVPEATVEPHDPHHFHHHLVHRKEAHYRGDRVPEDSAFYEEVAQVLVPADAIVLIGHGTGKSSAVDVLIAWLKKHHVELAQRVVATESADLSALTAPDVESLAKRHLRATPL